MKYQKLCEQFIKEKWIGSWSSRERDEEKIKSFASWLDSQSLSNLAKSISEGVFEKADQQKSGGKKKIEELELPFGWVWDKSGPSFNKMIFDKLNQLIKSHNENL